MTSPFHTAKAVLLVLLAFSLVGMLVGFLLTKTPLALIGVMIAFFSAFSAMKQVNRWIRIGELERRWIAENTEFGDADAHGMPERIFVLLCTVAEADGAAGPRERQVIRQFVLARFPDPLLAIRLARWDVPTLDDVTLVELLRDLRRQLNGSDRETIFHWCALVALIDERFNEREHELLQTIARHLGLAPEHARLLFLHAKSRVLDERAWRGGASGSAGSRRPRYTAPDKRSLALEALGLEANATPEQIRSRHRELVKKHHPDAHSHLGPVAQQEATERFRRIQEAYESLRGAG